MVIKGRTPLSIVPEVWLLLPYMGIFSLHVLCVMQRSLAHNSRNLITKLRPTHVCSPVCLRELSSPRAWDEGYMNLHNKKHGTYVDSAYTFFQFCPYPEDGLPIHCCSVSYSCDVSLRKLKLENCLCTGYFGSPFLPEREKEKALKSLNFRALL